MARIVSGAQTGVDRAALDAAMELGIPTGGWVPAGRRAEDGVVPERYRGLVETASADYAERTEHNVRDADATLVLRAGPARGGTALTEDIARRLGKPLLSLDLEALAPDAAEAELCAWLEREAPATLNVAGPRASQAPQLAAGVRRLLRAVARRKRGPKALAPEDAG